MHCRARGSADFRNDARTDVPIPSPPATAKVPLRAIVLLACAGFASQAMVRVTDSLLPQIAHDFNSSVGEAAIVVSAYSLAHGSVQLIIGPIADRFGKYKMVALMCALACVLVALCGLAMSLSQLALARFASGAAAGWIVPTSMAFVGDVTPRERLQPVLARYLSGQIIGQLFGQAAGGVLGDLFGWRNVFFVLAAMFALAALGLLFELATNPRTRTRTHAAGPPRFVADYVTVLSNPWARFVIFAVFIEASVAWGAFAYVGADLHQRFALSFTAVGLIVGVFGVGGLLYAGLVQQLVNRFGQPGLAVFGGVLLALGYMILAVGGAWWLAPLATGAIGLGFYALHNTMQTQATAMTPEARGTAVGVFSSAIYLGQMVGVAVAALIYDHFAAVPLFLAAALILSALGWWFAVRLGRQRAEARGRS
jgi:predicted MFS family arabinose efflux permease